MNYSHVSNILYREAKASGFKLTERKSVSTNSMYYTLHSAKASLMFRISDHKTEKNIITLRLDHKINEQSVIGFIKNRIKDLQRRDLKIILGI